MSTSTKTSIIKENDVKINKCSPDVNTCVLKFDHFENIHRLENTLITKDSPNFRKVKSFPVFGTGQPTVEGFKAAVSYVRDVLELKTIIWTNIRQEPVVYANGLSFTPREVTRLNENMEFPGITGPGLELLQEQFVNILENRASAGEVDEGKVRYYKDTYAEHPADRKNIEHIIPLEDNNALKTLTMVYEDLKNAGFDLTYVRLPIVDEKAPNENDFDLLTNALKASTPDTACFFNCQMGKGRTTTGMVIACLIKYILHNVGIIEENDKVICLDHNFSVIDKLLKAVPTAIEAKKLLDTIIDLCGEPPFGTGLQNLRLCIMWTKDKYDTEPDHKKPYWKHMGVNFTERYFYLICYATYLIEEAPQLLTKTFIDWMDSHNELRQIIKIGMEEFEWN